MLKKYLSGPKGNLSTIFVEYHMLLGNQTREIKGSLNMSLETQFKLIDGAHIFNLLHYRVSAPAFNRLMDEYKNGQFMNPEPYCKCTKMTRDGLPCYHVIGTYVHTRQALPEEAIHIFWRTLSISDIPEVVDDEMIKRKVNRSLMDDFAGEEFDKLSVDDQLKAVRMLNKIMRPEETKLDEAANFKHKGRPVGALNKRLPCAWESSEVDKDQTPPKKQKNNPTRSEKEPGHPSKAPRLLVNRKYHKVWPQCMGQYIQGWYKIISDGNCGYRSIALGLGMDQDDWGQIREAMVRTVETDWEIQSKLVFSSITKEEMIAKLNTQWSWPTAPSWKWFTIPDMGTIAATTFNVVLVILGENNSSTHLPVRAAADHVPRQHIPIICLGHIPLESHWVSVSLLHS